MTGACAGPQDGSPWRACGEYPLGLGRQRSSDTEPKKLDRLSRIVAATLAGIWIGGGLAGIGIVLWVRPTMIPVLLGLCAIGYGSLWARVAVTGRRLTWPSRRTSTGKER